MTPEKMRSLLRERIRADFGGSQVKFARALAISEPLVSMVLHGKRAPSARMLEYLHCRRVIQIRYVCSDFQIRPRRKARPAPRIPQGLRQVY